MKPSKRIKHAINDLQDIKECILYACAGNNDHYKANYKKLFDNIEDTLVSLAEDKKLFSIKLKKVWDENNS